MKKANFTLWEDHNKAKACHDSLEKTSEKCATRMEANGVAINACHSCGYAISYLFSRYDNFVTTSMENVFADINEKIGQSMNEAEAEARLARQGKISVKKVDEKTGEEKTVSKTEFNVSGESDVQPSNTGEIKVDAESAAKVA